jgi:regulator of PEP synthase PpsR (kinase-PPPase family)
MQSKNKKVHVFIVSDATGLTAQRVITAALVQFPEITPAYNRFPNIQTKKQIETILEEADKFNAIIIYSLVSEELRSYFYQIKRKKKIYAIDLLGPLLKRIGRLWDIMPTSRPGLLSGLDEASFRLSESIDYTLRHDDGQNIETLHEADIIILGISRTSKTPTSFFLSCNNNLKVANIPIIPFEPLPENVLTVKKRKIGFTISPEKVAIIRAKRLSYTAPSDYTDIEAIRGELLYSHKIFRQIRGIQIIDVSNSSIEEISDQILSSP